MFNAESESQGKSGLRAEFSIQDHFRAALNQAKFGWTLNPRPSFARGSRIHCLGLEYTTDSGKCSYPLQSGAFGNLLDFLDDYASRLWFTYREDFQPLCSSIDDVVVVQPTCYPGHNQILDMSDTGSLSDEESSTANQSASSLVHWSDSSTTSSSSDVPPTQTIPLSVQTSDCGWGCMIRSGQMLFGQALIHHFLGRNWRTFRSKHMISTSDDRQHRQIIRWFHDSWSPVSPFSIHRIVRASRQNPGTLFGPSTVCSALVRVMAQASWNSERLSQLHVYLARDRVIYRKDIMQLAKGLQPSQRPNEVIYTDHTANYRAPHADRSPISRPSESSAPSQQHAVILLIPLRLGPGKRIAPAYVPMVCRLFRDPCFVGLMGGRPKHSIYVIASVTDQQQQVVYLDPHFVQPVVDVNKDNFSVKSWHCRSPKIMPSNNLDPSCALGFYCRTQTELRDLLERLPSLLSAAPTKPGSQPTSLVEVLND